MVSLNWGELHLMTLAMPGDSSELVELCELHILAPAYAVFSPCTA